MAEDKLKSDRISVIRLLQGQAEFHNAPAFRLALAALCIVVTLAALSIGMADATRAQQCDVGNVLCEDGLCYPLGSQCCRGGGACNPGNNCWAGSSSTAFCCPGGTNGTADGYCVPIGFQYCGRGKYCAAGRCCNGGLGCCS